MFSLFAVIALILAAVGLAVGVRRDAAHTRDWRAPYGAWCAVGDRCSSAGCRAAGIGLVIGVAGAFGVGRLRAFLVQTSPAIR